MRFFVKDFLPLFLILFFKKIYNRFYKERKVRNYYLNSKIDIKNNLEDVGEMWERRIRKVKASPDNEKIFRHEDAGKLVGNTLIMHNGLKVSPMSYYGSGVLKMLIENKGVHEPQEEYVFQEVLKKMPAGASMLELGAYWGFYSLWFASEVENARCYLHEPFFEHLVSAKVNFELNNLNANFYQFWSGTGGRSNINHAGSISVDKFLKEQNIERLNILHSDIQGAEVLMLHNAKLSLKEKKIDFIFISTHSNNIHKECVDILSQFDYEIIASANCSESFSEAGILVTRSQNMHFNKLVISKNEKFNK